MSLGKHFINGVENPVEQGLRSLLRQDRALRLIGPQKVLCRQQSEQKVLLLSGGGSGHEPAHAGFLGEGMLDVCVAGEIFASPSASQVLAGLKSLPSPKGILMIVKNYTGDKLNFGLAAQKARAEGILVKVVFVGDDVSIKGNELVGRRGLAGVVLVHKIAGALAKEGASLKEVAHMAQNVADNLLTIGVSLDRCSVPNRDKQESLPLDELEYGMGIHNEPGARREKVSSLSATVDNALQFLLPSINPQSLKPVVVLINNLGGLSVLELNVIAEEVLSKLERKAFNIIRILVGTFVTSLDGPGFSVTILQTDKTMEKLLNARTTAPAWPNLIEVDPSVFSQQQVVVEKLSVEKPQVCHHENVSEVNPKLLHIILTSVLESVTKDEPSITRYDTIAGDGDCGETLLRGVKSVYNAFQTPSSPISLELTSIFRQIATTIEQSSGGTSGAIYAIFFNALSNALSSLTSLSGPSSSDLLAHALPLALTELCTYTPARVGHKTLMDALIPFVEMFASTGDFSAAVGIAEQKAWETRRLDAVLGRASYVRKGAFEEVQGDDASGMSAGKEAGVPDPGALGVVSILKGLEMGLKGV